MNRNPGLHIDLPCPLGFYGCEGSNRGGINVGNYQNADSELTLTPDSFISATTGFDGEDNMGRFYEGYEDNGYFATPNTTTTEATDYFETTDSCTATTILGPQRYLQDDLTNSLFMGGQFFEDTLQTPYTTTTIAPICFTDYQYAFQPPVYSTSRCLSLDIEPEANHQGHHFENNNEASLRYTGDQPNSTIRGQKPSRKLQRKRYTCEIPGCTVNPLGFTRKKDMLRHIREGHGGERPFVCSSEHFTSDLRCMNVPEVGCSRSFKRISHLKTHLAKKKMDSKFKAGAGVSLRASKKILGLNKRSRQRVAERKSAAREERETGGIIRKLTGMRLGRKFAEIDRS